MDRHTVRSLVGNADSEGKVIPGRVVKFHAEHYLWFTVFHISPAHVAAQFAVRPVTLLPEIIRQVVASVVVSEMIFSPGVAYDERTLGKSSVRGREFHEVIIAHNRHGMCSVRCKLSKQRLVPGDGRSGIVGVDFPSA